MYLFKKGTAPVTNSDRSFYWGTLTWEHNGVAYFFFFLSLHIKATQEALWLMLWKKTKQKILKFTIMQQAKSREKETQISMTQPALSGVSTKLHAHLLPAGHRQKPQR